MPDSPPASVYVNSVRGLDQKKGKRFRMRVTVVRPRDLGSAEAALWWSFQHSTPEALNPFMSLTFVQAVDRHRANARVAVVEDHGHIAAFLPFELHAHGMGMPAATR